MLPFAIGVMLAAGFGLLAGSVYGVESLIQEPWVILVLWGLVTGSGLMTLASPRVDERGGGQ
ncbi:MAG: hypothetical protein WBM40_06310 [Thiohalocapsa sp.]